MILDALFPFLADVASSQVWWMVVVGVIFVVAYALMLTFAKWRAYIAASAAGIFLIAYLVWAIIDPNMWEIFARGFYKEGTTGGIDWNVILMIAGTMGLVAMFIDSKMPALIADKIIEKTSNAKWAFISLSLFAGIISAFIDNVATVLIVAPIVLNVAKKSGVNPIKGMIAIAIASNLEGAATLVGDTTSIITAGHMNLNFADFFWYQGRPSLFFVNQIGLLLATLTLLIAFRKDTQKIVADSETKVKDLVPTILMISLVGLLIVASFIPWPDHYVSNLINGLICVGLMLVGIIYTSIRQKGWQPFKETLASIDFQTLLMLVSIFVMVYALTQSGIVALIGQGISKLAGDNLFLAYTIIVFVSVLVSAFIDNIPYVAMMLGVVEIIAINFANSPQFEFLGTQAYALISTPLFFGLLVGSTLGGNLTPVGASANITALGILRKEGYEVSTGQFMKMSFPYTIVAVSSAYIFVWLLYGVRLIA
ncbi:MAG: SLC13 family permease [Bacilli bacterium]|jgi:Na+/H+ antiporter NhaD/arsenite permease-like protein